MILVEDSSKPNLDFRGVQLFTSEKHVAGRETEQGVASRHGVELK